jgi:hypothetical protein
MTDPGTHAAMPDYEFAGDWADLSTVTDSESSWAHNGCVVTRDGEVIGFHAGQLVAFDNNGDVTRTVRPGLTEGHGITLVREGSEEYLWISDPGFVFVSTVHDGDETWASLFGKGIDRVARDPRVAKMTLDGEIVLELPLPPMDPEAPPGMMGQYCPCGTAVDEERFGGSGDIWVADGYGASLVHRFDKYGVYKSTLTGEEGGGRFVCPHSVFITRRGPEAPELYIADRENKRIQVYNLAGVYLRTVGETFLSSPSGFAQWGELLVVAELYSRLALLDGDDNLVGYIGADPEAKDAKGWPERPGWPNALAEDGHVEPPPLLHADRLNSPHSVTVDADGNLYISEWLLGGRYSKLTVRRD